MHTLLNSRLVFQSCQSDPNCDLKSLQTVPTLPRIKPRKLLRIVDFLHILWVYYTLIQSLITYTKSQYFRRHIAVPAAEPVQGLSGLQRVNPLYPEAFSIQRACLSVLGRCIPACVPILTSSETYYGRVAPRLDCGWAVSYTLQRFHRVKKPDQTVMATLVCAKRSGMCEPDWHHLRESRA